MGELRRLFDDVVALFDDLLTQYDGLYEEIIEGQGGPGFPLQPLPVKKFFTKYFNIDGTFFKRSLKVYTIIGLATFIISSINNIIGIKKIAFSENLFLKAVLQVFNIFSKFINGNKLISFNKANELNGTKRMNLEKEQLITGIKQIQAISNNVFVGVIQYSSEAIFKLEAYKIISLDTELGVYGKRIEKFYKGAEITGKRDRKNILLALDLLQ